MTMNGKKRRKMTAVVHCTGGSRFLSQIDVSALPETCAERKAAYPDGIMDCRFGCLGGGDCVRVCKLQAMTISSSGAAFTDREKCVGCGLCVKACPQELIRLVPVGNTIAAKCSNQDPGPAARKECGDSCIACRICEKNCPADAIRVIDNRAVIDDSLCIACGMCASKCPRGVICDANGIITLKR